MAKEDINIVANRADRQSRKGILFLRKAVGNEKAWVAQNSQGGGGDASRWPADWLETA
jgi:hypothetical protein